MFRIGDISGGITINGIMINRSNVNDVIGISRRSRSRVIHRTRTVINPFSGRDDPFIIFKVNISFFF